MLKIPKGLKKKKKDKKHKRKGEDDLFNKEELEQYRKEHQHQAEAAEATENAVAENANVSSSSAEKGEEWKKFNALTAGIDNILQKTQEDLDRIKSTSFFQRKAPPPPPPPPEPVKREDEVLEFERDKKKKKKEKKKVDDEKTAGPEESSSKVGGDPHEVEEEPDDLEGEEEEEEEESEEEFVDDSIFETSYVDAVASGELKLAYIPDSPEEKEDDFDPFDTSIADKFISSNPKKRYLNLGCAVEVLSGKASTSCPQITVDKRALKRRVKPVDLLLSSFDEGADPPTDLPQGIEKYLINDSPVKTLLDDGPLSDDSELPLPPAPAVTPVPATTPIPAPPPTVATTPQIDLSEFEISIVDTVVAPALTVQGSVESVDDEFERLAAESLARKSSLTPEPLKRPTSVDLLTQNVLGSPGSGQPSPINPNALVTHEADPFDTSVAEKHLLPGKQEISLLEKELLTTRVQLSQLEDDEFDPRADTPVAKAQTPPDILSKSPEEEVFALDGNFKPLTPQVTLPDNESPVGEDYDPFDTSHVNGAPGKLELKLIEKELAAADFEDDAFDPRAPQEDRPKITEVILNKYKVCPDSEEKRATEAEAYPDILTGDQTKHENEGDEFVPTVQPRKLSDPDEADDAYVDPFDTSIADHIAPGKTELKILENELIN